MPLTNLCNRLDVNEHPLDPTILERLALTSLIAPLLAAVAQPAGAGVGTEKLGGDAGQPVKASPTSSSAPVGAERASRDERDSHPEAASVLLREASTRALAFCSVARAESRSH